MPNHIHIFRTKLTQEGCDNKLAPILNDNPDVYRWHIDLEDIDKVLKVETHCLTEENILALTRDNNIHCEVLSD